MAQFIQLTSVYRNHDWNEATQEYDPGDLVKEKILFNVDNIRTVGPCHNDAIPEADRGCEVDHYTIVESYRTVKGRLNKLTNNTDPDTESE